jgi:hypothetical protein
MAKNAYECIFNIEGIFVIVNLVIKSHIIGYVRDLGIKGQNKTKQNKTNKNPTSVSFLSL